jgi:hypothetical protein
MSERLFSCRRKALRLSIAPGEPFHVARLLLLDGKEDVRVLQLAAESERGRTGSPWANEGNEGFTGVEGAYISDS